MRQRPCTLALGRVRSTLRRSAQSLQRTQSPPAKPIASGTCSELENTEPFAPTLPTADGTTAAAQQSDCSSSARTMRLYLGITPHFRVLSRALPFKNELVVRGEQFQRNRRSKHTQHHNLPRVALRRCGHGSQSTMSRCVRSSCSRLQHASPRLSDKGCGE